MKLNKKIKRGIGMVLLAATIITALPFGMMNKAEAAGVGLPMPKRETNQRDYVEP